GAESLRAGDLLHSLGQSDAARRLARRDHLCEDLLRLRARDRSLVTERHELDDRIASERKLVELLRADLAEEIVDQHRDEGFVEHLAEIRRYMRDGVEKERVKKRLVEEHTRFVG